jgi:hypothetical protein
MWQVAEQENMRRAEQAAMRRTAARAGSRSVVSPRQVWHRVRRDRRDAS